MIKKLIYFVKKFEKYCEMSSYFYFIFLEKVSLGGGVKKKILKKKKEDGGHYTVYT